jgi:hypothetical protein
MSVMGPLLIFIKYYWSWLFLGQKSATFLIAQTKKQKNYFWDKNKINKYDIVFLAETHIGYESNIHRVGTFYVYQICRPICRPNNRYFGGLAILTKSHIRPHVTASDLLINSIVVKKGCM